MGNTVPTQLSIQLDDPFKIFGPRDSDSAFINSKNRPRQTDIKEGTVIQSNIGLYSVLVNSDDEDYICFAGMMNISSSVGYSDSSMLREGDHVVFAITNKNRRQGIILSIRPTTYSIDETHPKKISSETKLERRTSFFGNDCYREKSPPYKIPLTTPLDTSTARFGCYRPTDLVSGEYAMINQHRNGILFGMYSASLLGGGAYIKLFSLENRIRIVADSIMRHTLFGNLYEWHNRRYLSKERAACLYQEERFGMSQKEQKAFDEADYEEEFYFTKNKKKKQTLKPRILEHEGYYGGLSAKYFLRPDPDSEDPRVMDDEPKDPGVARESVDPSGQYRLAATGMIGFERVGRIPVPVRIKYPWSKDAKEPKAEKLKEFKHSEENPFYRQLEHADRVAYDVKNSYARVDEVKEEFYVPEDEDLENKLKDVYDKGFTESTTVKLEKYDKRRSGIWQGEDGSIIIRDAWGSEIVMIGGNIQLSCAGNIQIMPGKTALTLAGDDIVHKAQNSIDIESADKDVRINGFKNVQILAGVDDSNPGGVTIEARGKAYAWDGDNADGGEQLHSTGILLKSHDGAVVSDADNIVIRSSSRASIISGKGNIDGGGGVISLSAETVNMFGNSINANTEKSALIMSDIAMLAGDTAVLAGSTAAQIYEGKTVFIPLTKADTDKNTADDVISKLQPQLELMKDDYKLTSGYGSKELDKMKFKFRNSQECGTDKSWEIDGSDNFTMYEPFWVQIISKFETLKNKISAKKFEDHSDLWDESTGMPWPGKDAVTDGKFAKLEEDAPINMNDDGMNKKREEIKDETSVIEVNLFDGYQIRDN